MAAPAPAAARPGTPPRARTAAQTHGGVRAGERLSEGSAAHGGLARSAQAATDPAMAIGRQSRKLNGDEIRRHGLGRISDFPGSAPSAESTMHKWLCAESSG